MAKKKRPPASTRHRQRLEKSTQHEGSHRSGGAGIYGADAEIGGDVVGRDKIVNVTTPLRINPPPKPAIPPTTAGFIGRSAELRYFADRLAANHLIIIKGMPGVGKTALATQLIKHYRQSRRVFWHSFHEGEGILALVWELAGFLAFYDQPKLWNALQSSTLTGNATPPLEVLLDYLAQMVSGHDYLLCLDDFQYIEDESLLDSFIARLGPALMAGEIELLIISQHTPARLRETDLTPLAGLSSADVRTLLQQHGVTLSAALLDELWTATEGNAQLIMFALDSLRHVKDPARLIRRLSEDEQIERFLLQEIDAGLRGEERLLLNALAATLGYPASREAIRAALGGASATKQVNDLVNRSLINSTEAEGSKAYSLPPLMRAFYYDLLDHADRLLMHQRLGEFYEGHEPDALRAALHFQHGHEPARAVRLIAADIWKLINRGEALAVRLILDSLLEQHLDRATQMEVQLSRGQILTLLGETRLARLAYATVVSTSDAQQTEWYTRACRGLGELLQIDAPEEAQVWLQTGLNASAGQSSTETAALRIRLGRLLAFQGQHEAAVNLLQEGLKQLPPGPSRLHITALGNLGNIACVRGDVELGLDYYRQVLNHAKTLNDYWAMNEVWINLGIELDLAGRWEEAVEQYQQARQQAAHLGSFDQQARALLGIGNTHLKQGEDARAQEALGQCLSLARAHDYRTVVIYASNSLANLQLSTDHLDEAERSLREAGQLAHASGVRESLAETRRLRAVLRLAQQRHDEALADAEQSVQFAREFGSSEDEGIGLRVLGRAQWATTRREEALSSFENSLRLIAERDPYETARTKVDWGLCLLSAGGDANAAQGTALLREARGTFQTIAAQRDMIVIDKVLGAPQ